MSDLARSGPQARTDRSGPFGGAMRDWLKAAPKTGVLMPLLAAPMLFVGMGGGTVKPDLDPPELLVDAPPAGGGLTVPVNARVEDWIRRFRSDERAAFERLMERRAPYADLIRKALLERGMPEELLYLAVIESGLSPQAVSHAAAVGMWQFMSPTAVQYGLRMDEWVDERRDPERATAAALDYLQSLHQHYGSWYLAAAAYNAGPGRVDRVLRRHAGGRTGEEALYWEVLEHLPRETREYVPRLLAASVLAAEATGNGFQQWNSSTYRVDLVFVPASTPLSAVARALDVDRRLLRDLNPHLVRGVTPPGEAYGVRVPVGRSAQVVAALGRGAAIRRTD